MVSALFRCDDESWAGQNSETLRGQSNAITFNSESFIVFYSFHPSPEEDEDINVEYCERVHLRERLKYNDPTSGDNEWGPTHNRKSQ